MEEQYLPTVPVPVHRMEIFDNSAKPDRESLKLPIRGYVQANLRVDYNVENGFKQPLSCVGVGKDPGRNSAVWNVHT